MRQNMMKVVEVNGLHVTAHEGKISALIIHYKRILGEPGSSNFSFRSICLQNCSVKVAAKLLTTWLQREISDLIDLDQTGFLNGRTIVENFVYLAELLQAKGANTCPQT